MTNCLKEQQQLVCNDVALVVNTFEQTNCSGIALRVILGSLSLRISVPPEVVCFWRFSFPEIHFVCSIESRLWAGCLQFQFTPVCCVAVFLAPHLSELG